MTSARRIYFYLLTLSKVDTRVDVAVAEQAHNALGIDYNVWLASMMYMDSVDHCRVVIGPSWASPKP